MEIEGGNTARSESIEEAAELGVARARKHYERLKNARGLKGLLGKVKVPKVPMKLPKKGK